MNALIKKHTYYYNANLFDNILITAFHYNPSPSEFHVFYFMNLVTLFWGEGHRLGQATTQTPGTRNNRNTCPAPVFHVQTRTSVLPPSLPSSHLRVAAPSQKGPYYRLPESGLSHHPGISSRSSLQESHPGLSPLSSSRPGAGTALLERTSSKHFRFCSLDSATSPSPHLSPR